MRNWRWYSKVLFALLVAAFAYWVWPTPWTAYAHVDTQLVRQNRFTGRVQVNYCLQSSDAGYPSFSEGAQQEIRAFALPYFDRLYREQDGRTRAFIVEHFRRERPGWDSREVARELEILVPPPQNYWRTLH